jgi:hypothetical protein
MPLPVEGTVLPGPPDTRALESARSLAAGDACLSSWVARHGAARAGAG